MMVGVELKIADSRKSLISEIDSWIDSLDFFQERFLKLGYQLPSIYISAVDTIRLRSAQEQSIRFYNNEKLKEVLYLQAAGGWWSPIFRKKIHSDLTSSYLNNLQKSADSGEYDFLEKDKKLLDVILDPNLIIYARWKLRDVVFSGVTWRQHLEIIEHQKRLESERIACQVNEFLPDGSKLGFSNIIKLIASLAKKYEFNIVLLEQGTKPRIIIEAYLSNQLSLYLEWEDYQLLRKSGDMEFRFVLREQTHKTWDREEKVPFFCLSLGSLIPGGELYLNTHRDDELIALSIFAHIDFMRSICKKF